MAMAVLVGEGLHKSDLIIGERLDFVAFDADGPEQPSPRSMGSDSRSEGSCPVP